MTHGEVPTSASLSARIIRACPEHKRCSLECPKRSVEDLGEIASFDTSRQSLVDRLKESVPWRHSSRT
jgi:hypothetical protein